jgi:hypothetical protein
VRLIFSSNLVPTSTDCGRKPTQPSINLFISLAPRFEVMNIMHREKSTCRLSPKVRVALSSIPSSNCHSASEALFDLVEQQQRELQLVGVPLAQRFLRQQRMRFAVSQVARRRADQLGDLV